MAALEFRVLGPLEVRRDGEVVPIPAPKQRALLGLLLLHANTPVAQEELIDLLWGDDAPPTARAALQNYVHGIRRLLGSEVLERQPGGYVVHVEAGRLDVERFDRLVGEARRAPPRERAAKLRDALACWRGPALVEFPREPFAQHEIGRLEEARLAALEDRIEAELELGRHAEAVSELETLVQRHPLRERFWSLLMITLYRLGRQADAAATYGRVRAIFLDQLGIEPSVGLRDLQRAILTQSPELDDPEQELGFTLERAAAILPREAPERIASLYDYGTALIRLGEGRRAASTLRAAARLAAAAGERALEERSELVLASLALYTDGRSPLEHLTAAERAARVLDALGDRGGEAVAQRTQASMLGFSGRCADGVEAAERAVALAREVGDRWEEGSCRSVLAWCLAEGPFDVQEALARCEEQLRETSTPEGVARVRCVLARVEAEAGRDDAARSRLEETLQWGRQVGDIRAVTFALGMAGLVEAAVGAYRDAADRYRAQLALLETENDRGAVPTISGALARVLARTAEFDEAAEFAHASRATVVTPDDFMTEVIWRSALALVDAHVGRTEEALRLSAEALARVSTCDMPLFRAGVFEDAALVRSAAGDPDGAGDALRSALVEYEAKGSRVGVDRVRRSLSRPGSAA